VIWRGYKSLIPFIVLALAAWAILDATGNTPFGGKGAGKRVAGKGVASNPAEFMYLDSARVESYLSQVAGESVTSESRQTTTTENGGVKLELPTVGQATGSTGKQLTTNVVVTQTAADRFQTLLKLIPKNPKPMSTYDCNLVNELRGAKRLEGTVVTIEDVHLAMPPYLSAYPELRYGTFSDPTHSRLFGNVPLASFQAVDESVRGTPEKERAKFKKAVGPNPRIPFSFSTHNNGETKKCKTGGGSKAATSKAGRTQAGSQSGTGATAASEATVLLPARFADLTGDPSLLSVPLTVVGLVVSDHEGEFGDGSALATYWKALGVVKAPLLGELGVRQQYLKMKRIVLRKKLFDAVERSLTYGGVVVEIIPIAMYDQRES
jgi:hypothetical protein